MNAIQYLFRIIDIVFRCDGGYPTAAWQYWVSTGIATGSLYGDATVSVVVILIKQIEIATQKFCITQLK